MEAKPFGLTAYQLKWIAVVLMTADHLAMIVEKIPALSSSATILRLLGRGAAPLFLFVLTESISHTRDKKRFLLRLYLAGALTSLFTTVTNLVFGDRLIYTPGNIIFTYLYVAIYVYLIENLVRAWKERAGKKIALWLGLLLATVVPELLWKFVDGLRMLPFSQHIFLRDDIVSGLLLRISQVEYSALFVLMGILLYFTRGNRKWQALVFLGFCTLSFLGSRADRDLWLFHQFFESQQFWMILALPMMLLYNGKRGRSDQYFFYLYYPIHRYLIALASKWIGV